MKSKFYLLAMCASVFCTGSVWGDHICPQPGDDISEGPWVIASKNDKDDFMKHWNTKDNAFRSAWLYDPSENQPAKCEYKKPYTLWLPGKNTHNVHFDETVVPTRSKSQPKAFHCPEGKGAEACTFLDGGRE